MILEILVAGLVIFITYSILYARWNYGSLEKLGIPVVKPSFIMGSDPWGYKKVIQHEDVKRMKKYGHIYGMYEGRVGKVFVTDPDIIKAVMVKDFAHFVNRNPIDGIGDDTMGQMLDFLNDEKWKYVRSQLSPMFSTLKLKQAGNLALELTEEYLHDFVKENPFEDRIKFDMKSFAVPFFVDLTAQLYLSIKLENRKDPNNFLITLTKKLMFEDLEANFVFAAMETFTFLATLFPQFSNKEETKKFIDTLETAIQQRKASGDKNTKDFIGVIIEMMEKLDTPEYKKLGINKDTIIAQAMEFFIAGYDSILATLTMLSYHLAKSPELQEKLIQEVDELSHKFGGKLDHTSLEGAELLTACITETVRLSPAFPRPDRICCKDWSYEENGKKLSLKKGDVVVMPCYAANRNPEIFPDPEDFKPERFLGEEKKKIHPYGMTSFGFGPRNCIGMRMAYEIVKIVISRFLVDFKFEERSDTCVKLTKGLPFITRWTEPIVVDLVKRDK